VNDKGFTNCYFPLVFEGLKSFDMRTISAKIGLTSGLLEKARYFQVSAMTPSSCFSYFS